jgi:septal ring factor EnvC (AmiA/AmiB activator)
MLLTFLADAATTIPNVTPAISEAAKQIVVTTSTDYIPYVASAISAVVTGVVAYLVGKKKTARSEFNDLVTANSKFREEIKKDLDQAKATIEKLERTINEKSLLIDEMQTAIADLKQQIILKETKISDMNMELIKKDFQIQVLKDKEK